ncbi:probable BOI-related E3 ubiquitin-protein ligase 3 [Olea europaea var. sylvestris]|uniref:Probable BOI-related E3 ubiquitin- ligase 2 n=1 Tax=Olea europaea subsp. europaea TaxID=158383 RepID=A0A8S0QHP2_OLEEU|nr:probable BOI-related E3 ubiquitin-protein ligase 3 [Olea europaea var. sylvestris]CAA2965395.1 probable BOI-related E3 ubiquitin- ligase 2 [Olea europaea subsp. europaea]
MASFPQPRFQQQPAQPQQSKFFRELYENVEGQSSKQATYFNAPNFPDHHPPYVPPYRVAGLPPGPVQEDNGLDLQWNSGLKPKEKRPKAQDFLENSTNNDNKNNTSQISSVDFLQSVSTRLGLSLKNPRLASSGDSPLFRLIGDDLDRELRTRDIEIDRYLKIQGDRLRQDLMEKVESNQLQVISYFEENALQKLGEKDAEIDDINKKNMDLELQIEQLVLEANAWQQRAKYNENMINTLKFSLQQVYAQSRDSKEGSGDSEVVDTASCCNGRTTDFHLLCKNVGEMKELMTCKVCRVNEVRMLLFPCKHLCVCRECESNIALCPLCHSSKRVGMEVYM